jgi:hypothetical protein
VADSVTVDLVTVDSATVDSATADLVTVDLATVDLADSVALVALEAGTGTGTGTGTGMGTPASPLAVLVIQARAVHPAAAIVEAVVTRGLVVRLAVAHLVVMRARMRARIQIMTTPVLVCMLCDCIVRY